MLTLRPADDSDSRSLWLWRNDPITRRYSANQDEVPWDDHCRWFDGVRDDPESIVLIAVSGTGERVGMVRFDTDANNAAVISINMSPESRGRGMGRLVLREALAWRAASAPGLTVSALVRTENEASVRLFVGAGFTELERGPDFVTMRAPLAPEA